MFSYNKKSIADLYITVKNISLFYSSNEVDETGAYYTEWSKSERKTPIQYTNAYIWNLEDGNDNPVCKTARETQMYWTVFWTLWERVRVGWYGKMALEHVNYHMWNESPVQVWCMIQDARGWCTGMTQRDSMGREVGGVYRMGNTCIPMVDSSQCMTEPIQCCKVK